MFENASISFQDVLVLVEGGRPADTKIRFSWTGNEGVKLETKVRWNTHAPIFKEEFMIPDLPQTGVIHVEVLDEDSIVPWIDLYNKIGNFTIFPFHVMESGRNGQPIQYMIGYGDDYVTVRTTWISL